MEALAVAICATLLSTVLNTAVQEGMKKILGTNKAKEVTSNSEFIAKEMGEITSRCRNYHNGCKDRSDDWRDKVTELKKLAYQIEDCVDRFKIGKITNADFADKVAGFRSSLIDQRDVLLDHIKQGQRASSSVAQGKIGKITKADSAEEVARFRSSLIDQSKVLLDHIHQGQYASSSVAQGQHAEGCRNHEGAWSKSFDLDEGYMQEEVRQVLDHSYNSLPSIDAETCLHYFSLFPSGYPIRRGPLLRRWMAEGAEVGCNSLTDNTPKALEKLKTLIDRNVIWPIQVSMNEDQDAKICRPPRAMLGYISDKSTKEGFVSSQEATEDQLIRRLSLHSLQTDGGGILELQHVSRVRTLVVSPGKGNNVKAAALSFDKCALLRVLDLEACNGPKRINLNGKICKKLKLLKYLSLGEGMIGYVPKEIEELKYLETLDVGEYKEKAVRVHIDVIMMPSLKHLIGKFKLNETILSRGFTIKGNKLETLAGFETRTGNGFPRRMHEMERLRKVKIFFDREARASSLSDRLAKAITAFLRSANPDHKGGRRSLSIDLQKCEHQVLGSLVGARGKLYSLKLCGGHKIQAPLFITKLNGITKLCLCFETLSWKVILDVLSNTTELKYLKLVAKEKFEGVDGVRQAGQPTTVLLIEENAQPFDENAPRFDKLERMCLQSGGNLPPIEIQGKALINLVSLHLICSDLGVPNTVIYNAQEILPLNNLKEVALQSPNVSDQIKNAWHEAARGHPKTPQVLFIEDPPLA